MGAGVLSVHQSGLGGGGHLVEQGTDGAVGIGLGPLIPEKAAADVRQAVAQGGGIVGPAAAAHFGIPAAQQTAPGGQTEVLAGQGTPAAVQYIHIKQAAQGVQLLQHHGLLLYDPRRKADRQQGLAAGDKVADRFLPQCAGQQLAQLRQPLVKHLAQGGGLLHCSGHVQPKADQTGTAPFQQGLLAVLPVRAAVQHLLQGAGRPLKHGLLIHIRSLLRKRFLQIGRRGGRHQGECLRAQALFL